MDEMQRERDYWEKQYVKCFGEKHQLQAELDSYRWIPVGERLPDRKGLYLVLWHNINDGYIQIRTCEEYIFDKDCDWGFTHWKPIILPKKGE